jgi:hypothetical protein
MPKKRTVRSQPAGAGDDREIRGGAFQDGHAKNAPKKEVREFQAVEKAEDWPILETAATPTAETATRSASATKA